MFFSFCVSSNFIFFISNFIFFSCSLPAAPEIQESHENQWKTMENHQKQRNMKKMKLQMKKKMKIWIQSYRFSLRTRKSSKTRGNFHFFIIFFHFKLLFFSFSLPVAPEIQENHENQWKTMENHQKQRKMKKKMKVQMKKNENLDSKLQILTPNQEIFKNSRKFSFFYHFFSFQTSFFFHFPCPWHLKSRKTMKINEKQWKTIKNKGKWKKNEVANEKKMKIWTQSCRFSLRTRKSSKTRGNFHFFIIFFSFQTSFFFIFLARGTWNPGKPWKSMKNNGKPSKTKENEKKWSCKWKKKRKFGFKVADSHSEPGNLQKLEEIFIFLSFFFHFKLHFFFIVLARCTWNPGKPWKSMKNNGKPSKTKEN